MTEDARTTKNRRGRFSEFSHLELISEEYASRIFKTSESVHFKSKENDLKEMGAITHLCPPSKPLR